jgi:hypothetical protein
MGNIIILGIFLDFSVGISKKYSIKLSFAFIVQKVPEKLLPTVVAVVAEFFRIFLLLWPERFETIWQQCPSFCRGSCGPTQWCLGTQVFNKNT